MCVTFVVDNKNDKNTSSLIMSPLTPSLSTPLSPHTSLSLPFSLLYHPPIFQGDAAR